MTAPRRFESPDGVVHLEDERRTYNFPRNTRCADTSAHYESLQTTDKAPTCIRCVVLS